MHYENPALVDKYSERFLGDGLRYEIKDFVNMINGDNKSGFKLTEGESMAMAEIMEKFLVQERGDEYFNLKRNKENAKRAEL